MSGLGRNSLDKEEEEDSGLELWNPCTVRNDSGVSDGNYFEEGLAGAEEPLNGPSASFYGDTDYSGERTTRRRLSIPLNEGHLSSSNVSPDDSGAQSFEILMREGRNKLYVAVEDKAAVEHLTKVIIFDVPTYLDADLVDPSPSLVWVRRRMVGIEARPQLIGMMEGDIPPSGTIYINGLGYKRVAKYLPQSMFCEKCNKWGHASLGCSYGKGCPSTEEQFAPMAGQEATNSTSNGSEEECRCKCSNNQYGNSRPTTERPQILPVLPEPLVYQEPQYNQSPMFPPSAGGTAATLETCLSKLTVMAEEGNQRLENLKRQLQRMDWQTDESDEEDENETDEQWKDEDQDEDDLDDRGDWIEVRMQRFEENLSRNIDDLLNVLLHNAPRKTEMKETGG